MSGLTPEQLERRRHKVTGSTVAAYLGQHPYTSPRDKWEMDAGLREFEGNTATRLGNRLEQAIAEEIQEQEGLGPFYKPDTIVHQQHPWWVTHPDFIFPEDGLALQVKNHEPHMVRAYLGKPGDHGPWDNDVVPIYHNFQCQWELGALNSLPAFKHYKVMLLGCYFGGQNLPVYRIHRDRALLGKMACAAEAIWRQHLDPDGPREPMTNAHWKAKPQERAPRVKLTPEELAAAPIPFAEPEDRALRTPIPFIVD